MNETEMILDTIANFLDTAPELSSMDEVTTERDGEFAMIVTINGVRRLVTVTELESEDGEAEED